MYMFSCFLLTNIKTVRYGGESIMVLAALLPQGLDRLLSSMAKLIPKFIKTFCRTTICLPNKAQQ